MVGERLFVRVRIWSFVIHVRRIPLSAKNPAGAKAHFYSGTFSAQLKSCPVTRPGCHKLGLNERFSAACNGLVVNLWAGKIA
jgi:hypothetical protein